jgi:hypothetical protein
VIRGLVLALSCVLAGCAKPPPVRAPIVIEDGTPPLAFDAETIDVTRDWHRRGARPRRGEKPRAAAANALAKG